MDADNLTARGRAWGWMQVLACLIFLLTTQCALRHLAIRSDGNVNDGAGESSAEAGDPDSAANDADADDAFVADGTDADAESSDADDAVAMEIATDDGDAGSDASEASPDSGADVPDSPDVIIAMDVRPDTPDAVATDAADVRDVPVITDTLTADTADAPDAPTPFICPADRVCWQFTNDPGQPPVVAYYRQLVYTVGGMEYITPWEPGHCMGGVMTLDASTTRCVDDFRSVPAMTIVRFYPAYAGGMSACAGPSHCPRVPGGYVIWSGGAVSSSPINQNLFPGVGWALTFTTP